MVRVPANARIVGGRLAIDGSSASFLAVGDPFACGRLIGAVRSYNTGAQCGSFDCYAINKVGKNGDGCGLFYQYTCETDILVTNLYREGNANQGGFTGGAAAAGATGSASAKWTGGRIVLTIQYLDPI